MSDPKRGKHQKYQNRKAYSIKYQADLMTLQEKTPKDNLCHRCFDQVDWKLKFGKYKVNTTPGRCRVCEQKTVVKSYRHLCDPCAQSHKLCAKCGEAAPIKNYVHKEKDEADQAKKLASMRKVLETFRECSRRKIVRLVKDEDLEFKENVFYVKSTGLPVENLQIKKRFREFGESKRGGVKIGDDGKEKIDDSEEEEEEESEDELHSDNDLDYVEEFFRNMPKKVNEAEKNQQNKEGDDKNEATENKNDNDEQINEIGDKNNL